MAKKLEADTVLILMNQFAMMAALKAVALEGIPNGTVIPILTHQMDKTEAAIKNLAVREL